MVRPADLSRRDFLRTAAAAGVMASVVPLERVRAGLQVGVVTQPPGWLTADGRVRFRRDGVPKVAGDKVFATDIRAVDMPGWPRRQSHAFMLRVSRADRRYEGVDLSMLDDGLRPDAVVTADDLERDGVAMPESDFYGPLFLARGETPGFLGQPVALLIFHDYARFRLAKRRLQFTQDAIRYGAETGFLDLAPYGATRYVRIGGPTPDAPDVFSPMNDTTVFAKVANRSTEWPEASADGDPSQQALQHARRLRDELEAPPEGWRVYRRRFSSQYVEPAAMETDNGNAWYDAAAGALHVVTGTQSPFTNAGHIVDMLRASRFGFASLAFHPGYTVGYGQKEHHSFPYYVAMAALYGDGRPERTSCALT